MKTINTIVNEVIATQDKNVDVYELYDLIEDLEYLHFMISAEEIPQSEIIAQVSRMFDCKMGTVEECSEAVLEFIHRVNHTVDVMMQESKVTEIVEEIKEDKVTMKTNTNLITVRELVKNTYSHDIDDYLDNYTQEELALLVEEEPVIDESWHGEWDDYGIIRAHRMDDGKFFYINAEFEGTEDYAEGISGLICGEEECLQRLWECGLEFRKSDLRGKNMGNNSSTKILHPENEEVPDTKNIISVEKQPTNEAVLDRYTQFFLKIGGRILKRCQDSLKNGWSGDQISYGHLKEIVRRPGDGKTYKNEIGIDLTNRLIPHISHRSSKKAVRIAPERMIQLTKDWVIYGIAGTDKEIAVSASSEIGYLKDSSGTKKGSRQAVIDLLHKNLWYVVKEFKPFKA